ITEKVISDFLRSYARPAVVNGRIPLWARDICPETQGLSDAQNAKVNDRLKQVAASVGARTAKGDCKANVRIYFTLTPQALLDDIAAHHNELLGYHSQAETGRLAAMVHPVQAYYRTSTRDFSGMLRSDDAVQNPECGAGGDDKNKDNSTANGDAENDDAQTSDLQGDNRSKDGARGGLQQ